MKTDITPRQDVFLNPGDFFFGEGEIRISTLLGSCVSITIWHPFRKIGGMCHYMLSEPTSRLSNDDVSGRYGHGAFSLFLQHMQAAGTHPHEYQAKLFGGGDMFNASSSLKIGLGLRNVEYGRDMLAALQIPLVAEHVGGSGRRKLHFELWNGHVWLAFPQGTNAYIRSTDDGQNQSNDRR